MARVCIVGAGAVGGYVGAHMAYAGVDVTFIDAWADNVQAMRKQDYRLGHAWWGISPHAGARSAYQRCVATGARTTV